MYTNPSDFYMSLMKDEEASTKLVELWKKADGEWVTTPRLTAPKLEGPFTNGTTKVREVRSIFRPLFPYGPRYF